MSKLAATIDYTLLKPTAGTAEVEGLCQTAIDRGYAAVCVWPLFAEMAADLLHEGDVRVAAVAAFPHGAVPLAMKLAELQDLRRNGATEADVVWNLPAFHEGEYRQLERELHALAYVAREEGLLLKVIIETGLMTSDEQLQAAARLCAEAEVGFVKTSTGWLGPGAAVGTVRRLRELLPGPVGIKASGGIRTRAAAQELVDAGATRIGTSADLLAE